MYDQAELWLHPICNTSTLVLSPTNSIFTAKHQNNLKQAECFMEFGLSFPQNTSHVVNSHHWPQVRVASFVSIDRNDDLTAEDWLGVPDLTLFVSVHRNRKWNYNHPMLLFCTSARRWRKRSPHMISIGVSGFRLLVLFLSASTLYFYFNISASIWQLQLPVTVENNILTQNQW